MNTFITARKYLSTYLKFFPSRKKFAWKIYSANYPASYDSIFILGQLDVALTAVISAQNPNYKGFYILFCLVKKPGNESKTKK